MYSVPNTPRPPLLPFLLQCMGVVARRGAFYGFVWGGLGGAIFFIIGALVAAPVGFAFGALVGALDGLICGLILYHWAAIFSTNLSVTAITVRVHGLRCFICVFSFLVCLLGAHTIIMRDASFHPLVFVSDLNWAVTLIPSLIAALCSHKATGDLFEWYQERWVFGPSCQPASVLADREGRL